MTEVYLSVGASSASDNWPTPQWIVDQAAAEFGPFDLDPAAAAANAKAPRYFTVDDNGLDQPWAGRVWLNPPYGRTIGAWMRKARDEVATGRAELVFCLVPVRVDARWWQRSVVHADPKPLVRFWPRRLKYVKDWDAPFASATVVYGWRSTGRRHGTVAKECARCGRIFWPARVEGTFCSDACRKSAVRANKTSAVTSATADIGPDPIGDIRAFLGLVRDDPGRAQMIARDWLRAHPA